MKKILYCIIIVLTSVQLFNSCIDETLPDSGYVSSDQIGNNPTAIEALAKGIPAAMVKPGLIRSYGSYHSNFALPSIHLAMEAMTGDMVVGGEVNYYWFANFGTGQSMGKNNAYIDMIWRAYYMWVKSTNDLIRLAKNHPENEVIQRHMADAYVYRAKCYLDLVRLYEFKENAYTEGGKVLGLTVPIVDENTTEDMAKNNARAKVEDAYDFIMSDLEMAEEIMLGLGDNSSDPYRPSVAAIYGMKARLYMEMASLDKNQYANASKYARMAINESKSKILTKEQWEDVSTGFNSASANAWIWALSQSSNEILSLYNFTAHMTIETSWSYAKMTYPSINRILYAKIHTNDFRKGSWIDPDRSAYDYQLVVGNEDRDAYLNDVLRNYSSIKFRPAGGNFDIYTEGGIVDIPLMRVEEMYFIEMEAIANTNLEGARLLLNDFMSHRYMNDAVYDCRSKTGTIEDFITEMITQKRIEFWGEGIVLFDLKRLGLSPTPRGYVGTNAPMDYRLNTDGRSPYWNMVISMSEESNNVAIENLNNPDPSNKVEIWIP